MADKELVRKLKIKTGVCRRIHKESLSYKKEADQQQEKVSKMKSEQKDFYDIKKQEEVLNETLHMIPDTQKRLDNAVIDLDDFMRLARESPDDSDIVDTEEWKAAEEILQSVQN